LTNVSDVRVIQYALTLLRDFIEADPERRARLVTRPGAGPGAALHVMPLLQLVGTSGSGARILSADAHPFVVEQAAAVAACMVVADPSDEAATSGFLSWVLTNMKLFGGAAASRQVHVSEVAVEALMVLMRSEYLRALLLEERGVERLLPLLAARNAQIAYDAGFCLWVLSLHRPGAGAGAGAGAVAAPTGVQELERGGAVAALANAVRTGQPLKLLRVTIGTLANLARAPGAAGAAACRELALTHVPGVLAQMLALDPRVPDPELFEDAKWLAEALAPLVAAGGAALGSGTGSGAGSSAGVERLERELATGRLEWGPTHTSDFWKQNAQRVERDGDFAVVKALIALLAVPPPPEGGGKTPGGAAAAAAAAAPIAESVTQAVALHDLGEFAAQHPQGRAVAAALGAKPAVMALLKRAEGDVKHQALLALAKIMTKNYAFVGVGAS
jgi:V-type H+-transporting ATPase subunit H